MCIIQVSRITLVVSARPADYRISGRWTYLAMSTPASWCQTFWFSKFLNWTIANVFQDSSKNLYVTLDCANTKQAKYYATVVKSGQVLKTLVLFQNFAAWQWPFLPAGPAEQEGAGLRRVLVQSDQQRGQRDQPEGTPPGRMWVTWSWCQPYYASY